MHEAWPRHSPSLIMIIGHGHLIPNIGIWHAYIHGIHANFYLPLETGQTDRQDRTITSEREEIDSLSGRTGSLSILSLSYN